MTRHSSIFRIVGLRAVSCRFMTNKDLYMGLISREFLPGPHIEFIRVLLEQLQHDSSLTTYSILIEDSIREGIQTSSKSAISP
ncbi:hypothetical protein NPIL_398891 [Nephila pilipes]|uniref:Uncharacterized protein n=1 Tax=Nephila pilipes TaxID=299642 RepID=A0A8X6R2N6_NEPPI|nr:hypothetical protein NPIL_398891 [Nephila pilipes]